MGSVGGPPRLAGSTVPCHLDAHVDGLFGLPFLVAGTRQAWSNVPAGVYPFFVIDLVPRQFWSWSIFFVNVKFCEYICPFCCAYFSLSVG